jgi:hypothetical protein
LSKHLSRRYTQRRRFHSCNIFALGGLDNGKNLVFLTALEGNLHGAVRATPATLTMGERHFLVTRFSPGVPVANASATMAGLGLLVHSLEWLDFVDILLGVILKSLVIQAKEGVIRSQVKTEELVEGSQFTVKLVALLSKFAQFNFDLLLL